MSETNSTLNFATGLKAVKLTATRKEIIEDPHALIQQYRVEIESLRAELKNKEVPRDSTRRLSRREVRSSPLLLLPFVLDRTRLIDLSNSVVQEQNISVYKERIRDLSSLILTSATVEEEEDAPVRPVSPTKIDFEATGPEVRHPSLFSFICETFGY
jgi:hypothetical protein